MGRVCGIGNTQASQHLGIRPPGITPLGITVLKYCGGQASQMLSLKSCGRVARRRDPTELVRIKLTFYFCTTSISVISIIGAGTTTGVVGVVIGEMEIRISPSARTGAGYEAAQHGSGSQQGAGSGGASQQQGSGAASMTTGSQQTGAGAGSQQTGSGSQQHGSGSGSQQVSSFLQHLNRLPKIPAWASLAVVKATDIANRHNKLVRRTTFINVSNSKWV